MSGPEPSRLRDPAHRPRNRPPFIALEGIEGAGKTTQAARLRKWLLREEIPHVVAREPGETATGEAIRALVLERADLDFAPLTELFLILASRSEFARSVARPVLGSGKVLIADRYSLSTLAYQGYGRGIDLETVSTALEIATAGVEPDLYILIDLPAKEGLRRASGRKPDRIESEGFSFLEKARKGYLELAKDPLVVVVDGSASVDSIHARIVARLREHFPETFGEPRVAAT